MIKCLDYLGFFHPKANWKLIADELPSGWGIRVLDDPKAFGSNHQKLRNLITIRPDIRLIGFHRHWDAKHKVLCPLVKLRNALPKYESFTELVSRVLISHTLEYSSNDKNKINNRITVIKNAAPTCRIVQSCMKGYYHPSHMVERHGDSVADVVSSDGIDIWDLNVSAWLKKNKDSYAVCAWFHSCNGRKKGEVPKPFKQRDNWPTKTELRRAFKLMEE